MVYTLPMRRSPFVITLTSLALQGSCAKEGAPPLPGNPPLQEEEVILRNPPPQDDALTHDGEPEDLSLPTWDEVSSGHPEGATNPPAPVLAVSADGRCFKEFRDLRLISAQIRADGGRILGPDEPSTGVQVQCPPEAGPLLERARGG